MLEFTPEQRSAMKTLEEYEDSGGMSVSPGFTESVQHKEHLSGPFPGRQHDSLPL